MKVRTHKVTSAPRIDHDLQGEHLHLFVLDFASGIVELPSACGFGSRILALKKVSATPGEIVIVPKANESVDGEASATLSKQYQTIVLAATDENGWMVASAFAGNQGDKQ